MSKGRRAVVALAVVLGLAGAGAAEDPPSGPSEDSQRSRQQEEIRKAFRLSTADGRNQLHVGAAAHVDGRVFFGDSVAPDSFDIRRARLDADARLYGFMTLRVQAAMEGSPYIRNAWLDLELAKGFHLRLGQMKVPFSTEWLTLDNQVNFLERGTSQPVYPFFDRGVLLWGEVAGGRLTYNLGAYNGAGVDVDASRGDIDDHKDVVLRLFAQPFRGADGFLGGLYLAGQGTYGSGSVPTSRFELGGLTAANYQSNVWRWRTEQTIGSALGASDRIAGTIGSRRRWGGELLWARGPVAASVEWLELQYRDVEVFHDYWVGSSRLRHEPLLACDGGVRSISAWVSVMLTGESKQVDNAGWTQPEPERPFVPGEGGVGAWELRARFSTTDNDEQLFASERVYGFAPDQLPEGSLAVGEGGSVTASVLQGATTVHEATVGLGWTVNRNLRFQLDATTLWAPDFSERVDGIVSGGNSDLADASRKGTLVEREHSLGLRCIFRV